jgi:metal-responsive CopG/Arc/MetJ family transcriptional regulator
MANRPHPETVTVSFTLPRQLAAAVEQRARQALTNKSDIIRRALLDYLPPEESEAIMRQVLQDDVAEYKVKPTKKGSKQ